MPTTVGNSSTSLSYSAGVESRRDVQLPQQQRSSSTTPALPPSSPGVSKTSLVFNVSQTYDRLMKRTALVGGAVVSPPLSASPRHSSVSPSSPFVGSPVSTSSSKALPVAGAVSTFVQPAPPGEGDRRLSIFSQGDDEDDDGGLQSDDEVDGGPRPPPCSGNTTSAKREQKTGRTKSVAGLFATGLQFLGTTGDDDDGEELPEQNVDDDDDDEGGEGEATRIQSHAELLSLLTTNDASPPPRSVSTSRQPFARHQSRGAAATASKSSQRIRHEVTPVSRTPRAGRPSDASGPLVDFATQHGSMYSLNRDPSMHSMGSKRSLVSTADRQKNARERRTQLHITTRLDRERDLEDSRARLEWAAERKAVMVNQGLTQRHWAWASLVYISRFCNCLMKRSHDAIRRKRLRDALLPKTLLIARRWLRRTRLNRLLPSAVKPNAAEFRNDRTLNLFSDAHLEHLVEHLELRYFFTNETIIFMGSEDDECFVMCRGSADVLVGPMTVSHINKPGLVFGSVGMISGEPRTASIVAREPSLVWVCTRTKFEAFGMTDNRVQEALGIIADLRQNNLRAVYRRYISASYLATFHPLRDLANACIDGILSGAGPLVAKQGVSLVKPFSLIDTATHRCYFLLRGTIKVLYQQQPPVPTSSSTPLAAASSTGPRSVQHYDVLLAPTAARAAKKPSARELVQRLVQFPLRGARVTFLEETKRPGGADDDTAGSVHPALVHLDDPAQVAAIADGGLVATLKGPLLLNVAPLVVNDALPFRVETGGGCDMLYMTRAQFMNLDPVDIDNVRRGCYDMRREFLSPLPLKTLRTAMCRGTLSASAFPFLKLLDAPSFAASVVQNAAVFLPGESLYFDPDRGMYAHVVLSGQLQGVPDNSTAPTFWPDLHMVYFGSVNAKATAVTRLDVLRISRKDIVDWLVTQLALRDMETFVEAMKHSFEVALHRAPYFSFEGIEATTLGAGSGGSKALRADGIRRKKSILALHRTANFNVNPETVDVVRASQHRSLNAALVYQEATDGRQDDDKQRKRAAGGGRVERTLRTLKKLRDLEEGIPDATTIPADSDNNHGDDGVGGNGDGQRTPLQQQHAAAPSHALQTHSDNNFSDLPRCSLSETSTAPTDLNDAPDDTLFLDLAARSNTTLTTASLGRAAAAPTISSVQSDEARDVDDDDFDDDDSDGHENESSTTGFHSARGHPQQDESLESSISSSVAAPHSGLTSFLSCVSNGVVSGSLASVAKALPASTVAGGRPCNAVRIAVPVSPQQPPAPRLVVPAASSLSAARVPFSNVLCNSMHSAAASIDPLRSLEEFELVGADGGALMTTFLAHDAFGGASSRRFSTSANTAAGSLVASTRRNPLMDNSYNSSSGPLTPASPHTAHPSGSVLDRSQHHTTVVVNRRPGGSSVNGGRPPLQNPAGGASAMATSCNKATPTSAVAVGDGSKGFVSAFGASMRSANSQTVPSALHNNNNNNSNANNSVNTTHRQSEVLHHPRSPQLAPSTSPRTPLSTVSGGGTASVAPHHHNACSTLPARYQCAPVSASKPLTTTVPPVASSPWGQSLSPSATGPHRSGHQRSTIVCGSPTHTATTKPPTGAHKQHGHGGEGGAGGGATLQTLVTAIRTSTATRSATAASAPAVPLSVSLRQPVPSNQEEPKVQYLPAKLPRPKAAKTTDERKAMRLRNQRGERRGGGSDLS